MHGQYMTFLRPVKGSHPFQTGYAMRSLVQVVRPQILSLVYEPEFSLSSVRFPA